MAALDGEVPAARHGHFPGPGYGGSGQWILTRDRFDHTGVTAHYWDQEGRLAVLGAVTVHGRTGPRIRYEGIELVGAPVSRVDAALMQHADNDVIGLRIGCSGDLGPAGLNMYVRADRVGDTVVSGARSCAEDWEDHGAP